MLKNYITIALRTLFKHKTFSIINLVGLAIGIAAFFLISAYVQNQMSYDSFWENANRLYRIRLDQYQHDALQFSSAKSYMSLGAVIGEVSGVEKATRLLKDKVTAYTPDQQVKDVDMFWADSTVFQVLNRSFLFGSADNPFPTRFSAVISQSLATQLYGDKNPYGQQFKLNEGWEFTVSGVFEDIPENSHISMDMLVSIPSLFYYIRNFDNATGQLTHNVPDATEPPPTAAGTWRNNNTYTYILTNENAPVTEIESALPAVIEKYAGVLAERGIRATLFLQPIGDIHLDSHLDDEIKVNGDKNSLYTMSLIGLIILVIAWINFVNLTVVRAVERAKEAGLRKVAGASRSHLLGQFLFESLLMNVLSVMFAVCFIWISRHYLEQLLGQPLHFLSLDKQFYFILGSVLLIGALLSGLYPALLHATVRPIQLFKGFRASHASGFSLRKVLVVLQFTASIFLLIGTFTVYRQIQFMRSQALGVNLEHTLVTYSPMSMIKKPDVHQKLLSFKAEINRMSGVKSIATSSSVPGKEIGVHRENIHRVGDEEAIKTSFSIYNVDADFFSTYNIKLLAGRLFRHEEEASTNDVIINEKAMQQLGFPSSLDAVNQYITSDDREYRICGVIQNYHNESLKKAIEPILFFKSYQWPLDVGYYSIKIESTTIQHTIAEITEIWNRFYPADHFSYFFADDAFDAQYKADQQFGRLFSIFSALAILIASLGLLGLIAYAAKQRTKEIGVRKVLGASVTSISSELSWDYIKWTLLANLFAWPLAGFVMHNWLQGFAYRIGLSWWIFVLAGGLAFLSAAITVSWQLVKASTANPIEALRYE